MTTTTFAHDLTLTSAPLTIRTGSVISGVRLGADLDPRVIADIRSTLLARKVVFFRDQQHLDTEGQVAFARLLGELTSAHPTVPGVAASAHVLPIDSDAGRADSWHTDVTFVDRPPAFSVLRALTLPSHGGDTVWANTVTAYDGLPAPLRTLAESLRAVHTNAYDYAAVPPGTARDDSARRRHYEQFVATVYETEHPVVRVHPESGERSLLLGGFVRAFAGIGTADFRLLYRVFQDHITSPENTVRWTWRPGDVAIWDNRATQHYAVNDYGDLDRQLHRVTVAGEVPVGIDGRHSTALAGDSSSFVPQQ